MKTTKETHYVYKITNLNPINEEQYYIGVRTSKDCSPIEDEYMGSSEYLDEAIHNQGLQNFKKDILSVWDTREAAHLEEVRLHEINDVAKNPIYYNRIIASINGYNPVGNINTSKKLKKTINNSDWKSTIGVQQKQKTKNTRSKLDKNGNNSYSRAIEKGKITKEVIGNDGLNTNQRGVQKALITKSTKRWKETIGANQNKQVSETMKRNGTTAGANNPRAKIIYIFNSNNILQYETYGTFKETCEANNLPYSVLIKSVKDNGKPIYQTTCAKTKIKGTTNEQFIGWYAISVK